MIHSELSEDYVPMTKYRIRNSLMLTAFVMFGIGAGSLPAQAQEGKIAPILAHIRDQALRKTAGAAQVIPNATPANPFARFDNQGQIQVLVVVPQVTNQALTRMAQAGLQIQLSKPKWQRVQGWISLTQLNNLAALDVVQEVRLPAYGRTRVGAVTTEGDRIHKADVLREKLGLSGEGIRVGVISDGVNNRETAQATGDLPPVVLVHPTQPGFGDEGTAMLEIVHDLAPNAELFFSAGSNGIPSELEFIESIDWFIDQGCRVIVDDLGFLLEPYFEDGIVALAVRDAIVNKNIVYCTAAGNGALEHYQGLFLDAGNILDENAQPINQEDVGFHLFSGKDDTGLDVDVPADGFLQVIMQWAEPFGNRFDDYDVIIANDQKESLATGFSFGANDPLKAVFWTNDADNASDETVQIRIKKMSGVTNRQFELLILTSGTFTDNVRTTSDSIFGHPAIEEAISCGAVPEFSPNFIESFSSRGPTTILFPDPEIRQVPFCVAVDGVRISGAGGFPSGGLPGEQSAFFGTSAAAPHAAGLAALLLSANPKATPADIRNAFAESAFDLGFQGFDFTYGHGRLDVELAFDVLGGAKLDDHPNAPPACTSLGVPEPVRSTSGVLDDVLDEDVFCFTADAADQVSIDLFPFAPLNVISLRVFLPDGTTQLTAETGTRPSVFFEAQQSGNYFIVVSAGSGGSGNVLGEYQLTVISSGPGNDQIPLLATAQATPTIGVAPVSVQFAGASNADATTLVEWDFGDGIFSNSAADQHTYLFPGTYTAIFRVVDTRGRVATASAIVNVLETENLLPSASINAGTTLGQAPLTVQFTGIGQDPEGDPVQFEWDFGDGGTDTGESVEHTFVESGAFTVVLTATDPLGGSSTAQVTVQVGVDAVQNELPPGQAVPTALPMCGSLNGLTLALTVMGFCGIGVLRRRF